MNEGTFKPASANADADADAVATVVAAPQLKPIRFVTNHEGPYAKRRRINSACLTCRKKKIRCSGERPLCGTCLQNKHQCAGYGLHDTSPQGNRNSKKSAGNRSNVSKSSFILEEPVDSQFTSSQTVNHHKYNFSSNSLSLSTRNRMPYFRYFGPTAIMPGFKQMVVKVHGKQHESVQTASDANDSSFAQPSTALPSQPESRPVLDIPVYDTSAVSPSPLIINLCKLFFLRFGCCFRFLQADRFMRDLEQKQVDAILVDAVCALAARFSHRLFMGNTGQQEDGHVDALRLQPSEYGQAFASRAKLALVDAFACPTVAIVQATLLLAYDEFGAGRDSGLWVYLGLSIRIAVDLGMHTRQGLRLEGIDGPTPISVEADMESISSVTDTLPPKMVETLEEQERRAVERERLDTFWSIFFLDRVISSGTGRPVTLRECDIEISFPSLSEVDPASGWPLPFPALIRIIHLYGRVTDLLNRIKNTSDITDDLQRQFGALEDHLTLLYQNLSPKLHFNAVNFQQYAKFNQGTNFLLLHCWFHTLIVLLHQPTLLKTLEGAPQPLSTNSRELSMSSAKTVADILAFTELIDPRSGMGNPFTSQPIYIAACAFLNETAIHSASPRPQSGPSSPRERTEMDSKGVLSSLLKQNNGENIPESIGNRRMGRAEDRERKQAGKHTLLALAANQNYQRCYRALKALETYWAGVKYILTVLDQKATGVVDPLLYTREEMESALEMPRTEPSFTSPGWRRKLSRGTYSTSKSPNSEPIKGETRNDGRNSAIPRSPMIHPNQAIGWSLTGTMHSNSTNVAVMYASDNTDSQANDALPKNPSTARDSNASLFANSPIDFNSSQPQPPLFTFPSSNPSGIPPAPSNQLPSQDQAQTQASPFKPPSTPDPILVSDADLLLHLHSPFSGPAPRPTIQDPHPPSTSSYEPPASQPLPPQPSTSPTTFAYPPPLDHTYSNMLIDMQDVDMSVLGQDMMPWDLEYLPHDMLYVGEANFSQAGLGKSGDG